MQTTIVLPTIILNNPFLSLCPMGETVDQVWESFVKPLNDAIHLFVPTKVICTRSSKKAKWYPRHIRRALAKKRQLWRFYRKSRMIENRSLYDKQSALVKKLIYDREKQVEQSVINKAKLGSFYRFVNRKLSRKSGIGPLKADWQTCCRRHRKS